MNGTLTISDDNRSLSSWSESEILQAIERRRRNKEVVCVRLRLQEPCADVLFSTPACAGGAGVGRAPSDCERRLFDLWEKHRLNTPSFSAQDVLAFLKAARHEVH